MKTYKTAQDRRRAFIDFLEGLEPDVLIEFNVEYGEYCTIHTSFSDFINDYCDSMEEAFSLGEDGNIVRSDDYFKISDYGDCYSANDIFDLIDIEEIADDILYKENIEETTCFEVLDDWLSENKLIEYEYDIIREDGEHLCTCKEEAKAKEIVNALTLNSGRFYKVVEREVEN